MKRFIVNETFEHEGNEYAQGAIYEVTPEIEMLMPLWTTEDKVRDPDVSHGDDDDEVEKTIEEAKARREDDDDDNDDEDDDDDEKDEPA